MRLVLALLVAMTAAAGADAADPAPSDLCAGQEGCTVVKTFDAGHDAGGAALKVVQLQVPDLTAADGTQCNGDDAGPFQYWLLRQAGAVADKPQLVMEQCLTFDLEPPETTVAANSIDTSFLGNGGGIRNSFDMTYSLSPLRLTQQGTCGFTALTDTPSFEESSIDLATLRGEGDALSQFGAADSSGDEALGCDKSRAKQFWLVVPRVKIDTAAMQQGKSALGTCAALLRPDGTHGYVIEGTADAKDPAELRVVAPAQRTLLIQLVDPARQAGKGNTIAVWTSDTSKIVMDADAEKNLTSFVVDADSGAVTLGAPPPPAPPNVTRWTAAAGGGRAALFLVSLPAADALTAKIFPSVTVVYRRAAVAGQPARTLATSKFDRNRADSLGEIINLGKSAACAVQNGALNIVDPGPVATPVMTATPPPGFE